MTITNMKTVSLILGSGGARGLAHIGVIHWLEENNYQIRSIVGCSIGAVVGGIYAAGNLVDGGVLNPVPIAPTFGDDTDITIAVNLGGPDQKPEVQRSMSANPVSLSSPLRERINRFLNQHQQTATSRGDGDWGAYDIAIQAFESMQSTIARQKLAAYPPDKVIEIAGNSCRILEFERTAEMIELGYRRAKECLTHY